VDHFIIIGRFGAPFGVRGEIKVHAFSEQKAAMLAYDPWYIEHTGDSNNRWQRLDLTGKRALNDALAVKINGYTDRDKVKIFTHKNIAITRDQLPPPPKDEFYWSDLTGLSVENLDGQPLGQVERIMPTGANEVLVVTGDKRRLIPFVMHHFVIKVDLKNAKIIVDWPANEPE
jgi:16S rRNA processing protein RimM